MAPRELEAARLLAADLRLEQIASRMMITQSGVKGHLHRARRRLGVQTNAGLLVALIRRGVIDVAGGVLPIERGMMRCPDCGRALRVTVETI